MSDDTNNKTNGFIKKPGKGWLHPDAAIQEGILYNVKYVGCIGVNESMKSLSFEVRTQVARESIRRVAERTKLLHLPRHQHHTSSNGSGNSSSSSSATTSDEELNRILSSQCVTQWSGMNVGLLINTQSLKVTQSDCNAMLFQHTMQNISFACGGDTDIQDFVAYVAKDELNWRACYVFECGADNLANVVITTIGQAFELRFRKFLSSMPSLSRSAVASATITKNSNSSIGHQLQSENAMKESSLERSSSGSVHLKSTSATVNKNDIVLKQQGHEAAKIASNQTQQQQQTQNKPPLSKSLVRAQVEESLENMRWFHGLMTRDSAEKLLISDGDYLVRETNKVERQYVLSGKYKGECRHIFLVDPSGVVRTKDRVFDSISHLIQYHQDNTVPIISKENELLLENPIYKH